MGRKTRKLQKSKKTSRTKVLPLTIRKPRRYSTAQWKDAWKHFFRLLHYTIIYSPEISEQGNGVQSKSWYSCVNHEKSKKLSKRSSLSSNRIFSKWPRTLAERRPHKTKKWPIVDSILVPHVSSTILKWKQRKTPSKEYERSCGNSKRTSTWGNEQKKGWYRSSSRNAPILLPAIELVSGNTKKHKHSTSCSYLLYFWLLSIFYTLTLISKSNASEFKVFSTLFPVQIGIESVLILIVRQIARELTE